MCVCVGGGNCFSSFFFCLSFNFFLFLSVSLSVYFCALANRAWSVSICEDGSMFIVRSVIYGFKKNLTWLVCILVVAGPSMCSLFRSVFLFFLFLFFLKTNRLLKINLSESN